MNITLVEPASAACHIYSRFKLPRLGLPILGQMAKASGHHVEVFIEEHIPVSEAVLRRSDLVGISITTSTAPAGYRISDLARRWGVPTVIGGPHASALPDEALRHADWVLRGEAEEGFLKLLDLLHGRSAPTEVPGLSWRESDQLHHNPLARPVDLDRLPVLDFSCLAGGLPARHTHGVLPVQTSRGCPHACNFCSVTAMFGRKLRFASPEKVAAQLEALRGKGNQVFFYDDNFCASPTRTKRLLDYLLTKNVFLPSWTAQVSVRAARDEEMLGLMQRAGCRTVFVGFESFDDRVLESYHKGQTAAEVRQSIECFHRNGIRVHGMFMAGADGDDRRSILRTAETAKRLGIDTIQLMVLTPLPGTPVFDEMRSGGRISSYDWSLYDAHHAVFQPKRMGPVELAQAAMRAMSRFYSRTGVLKAALKLDGYRMKFTLYARRQLRRWRHENRELLHALGQVLPSAPQPARG